MTAITWHVYRFRSETGELLYVGYTRRLEERIRRHRSEKPWWPEVADIQSQEFTDELAARLCEQEAYATEQPKYNQNSPFRTWIDYGERNRQRRQTPEYQQKERERDRRRIRNPAYIQRKRERRNRQRWGRPRGYWQQEGPGLF